MSCRERSQVREGRELASPPCQLHPCSQLLDGKAERFPGATKQEIIRRMRSLCYLYLDLLPLPSKYSLRRGPHSEGQTARKVLKNGQGYREKAWYSLKSQKCAPECMSHQLRPFKYQVKNQGEAINILRTYVRD